MFLSGWKGDPAHRSEEGLKILRSQFPAEAVERAEQGE
jgi:hypothetical protein